MMRTTIWTLALSPALASDPAPSSKPERRLTMRPMILSSALLALLLVSGSASAVDLTGSWSGTIKFKAVLASGQKVNSSCTLAMNITQSGTNLNVEVTDLCGPLSFFMNGASFDLANKPNTAKIGIANCENNGRVSALAGGGTEEVWVFRTAKRGEKLMGRRARADPNFIDDGSINLVRNSTANPGAGSCP
jgi:hypothetical protein